jgi:DNA anti-recombination protein RmuC
VDRARLKLAVHEAGWLTRFRTFDARADNHEIEKKASELMTRLDIFTKLICLPSTKDYDEDENDNDYEGDTEETNTIANHKNIVPVTPTTLALRYEFIG